MKGSPSSSTASGSKPANVVLCKHNYKAVMKTIDKGRQIGKNFYGCPLWPNGCGFFVLEEDLQSGRANAWQMNDYEEKLKKLQLKKEKFRMEVMYLKDELTRHLKGGKMLMYALICSWIIFAFSWMVKM